MITVTGVDFAVPSHYGIGERFATWEEAVEYARSTIKRTEYEGQTVNPDDPYYHPLRKVQKGRTLVSYSRAFVQMREIEPVQARPGSAIRSGGDTPVRSWEVFHDGTAERQEKR